MPKFLFHPDTLFPIHWHFDRAPEHGEKIVLGEAGVFIVGEPHERTDPSVDAEYAVTLIRPTEGEELAEIVEHEASFTLPELETPED